MPEVLASTEGSSRSWPSWSTTTEKKSKVPGMNISVRARKLAFDRDTMWIELDDGRSLGVPLAWFPRLMRATAEQRESYRIGYSGNGLHWEDLDEDISVEGLLMGQGDNTQPGSRAA